MFDAARICDDALASIAAESEANLSGPGTWPLQLAWLCKKAMKDGKSVIDPAMAMKLTMEAAIAMSKIDLENACAAST